MVQLRGATISLKNPGKIMSWYINFDIPSLKKKVRAHWHLKLTGLF